MNVDVGILFLALLCADILLIPVWWPLYVFPLQSVFRSCERQRRWKERHRKYEGRRWNFVSSCRMCWDSVTFGLGGRHIYFWYYATSGCVGDNVVETGDIDNMDVGVGILFLAVLCAEIVLLPVWAAAISIFGITRLPVTSSTTPLNSWTSKTWI